MQVDKWIYGEKKAGNELKELKIKVPLEFHIKLHGLKLLSSQSISRSVECALRKYFAELEAHDLVDNGSPTLDKRAGAHLADLVRSDDDPEQV